MAQTFREFEHEAWQAVAACYSDTFAQVTQQCIEPMLDALQAHEGTRFLDVGCGPGFLSAAAHARGAEATGIDFSSSMVAMARARYLQVRFEEADAEDLRTFHDSTFDAVGMNFCILHLAQPEKALRAAHRVLKTGGRIAFTVWASPQPHTGHGIVNRAIERFGSTQVGLPPAPSFFHFSDPAATAEMLGNCGFASPQMRVVEQTWRFSKPEDIFNAYLNGSVRMAALLKGQTPQALERIKKAVCEDAGQYMQGNMLHIAMPAVLHRAEKIQRGSHGV